MTPDSHTLQETMLQVSDGHSLYVQDWGKVDASAPIIYLHGGPGDGCTDSLKQRFDPTRQRVVFFDQRGAGKSLPFGELTNNTTQHLVADISAVADAVGLSDFVLCGGSWGSCLALAYGLEQPERVRAMVLDGILTGSRAEIAWLDEGRFQTFFPDVWQRFVDATPPAHRDQPTAYHFKRILSNNAEAARLSGAAYAQLEASVLQLDDRPPVIDTANYDPTSLRIEVHYLQNGCFLPDGLILQRAVTLTMPIWLIQGRYDMICPPITAYQLASQLPDGRLHWTINGHRAEHEARALQRIILQDLPRD